MFYKDIVLEILEKYQSNANLGSEICRDQIAQEIEDEIIIQDHENGNFLNEMETELGR